MEIAIASGFRANYGGNFIAQLKSLAEKLEENQCKVVFIFPKLAKERTWCKELISNDKKVIFSSNKLSTINGLFFLIQLIVKYKIYHIHSNFGFLDIPSALISLIIPSFKHIIHARAESASSPKKLRYLIQRIKHTIIYKRSFVISIGNSISKEYESFGFKKERMKTIENGVSFQRLNLGKSRIEIRKELGLIDDFKLFLMMGYDIWIKGVDIACDAFFELNQQNKKVNYLLGVVVASNIDSVKKQIFDKYGYIPSWLLLLPPKENIGDYYRGADCFISASRTEGFSNAVVESIKMKLPVIVSNIIGTAWALQYSNVVSFKSEDHKDLLNKINNIFNIVTEQNLVDSSNTSQLNYGIDKWAEKIVAFYRVHGFLML